MTNLGDCIKAANRTGSVSDELIECIMPEMPGMQEVSRCLHLQHLASISVFTLAIYRSSFPTLALFQLQLLQRTGTALKKLGSLPSSL